MKALAKINYLNFIAKKSGITNMKKLFRGKTDQIGIYFSKKFADSGTLEKFNKAFEQLQKGDELKKILMKYNFKE